MSEDTQRLHREVMRLNQERRFGEAIPIALQIQSLLENDPGAEPSDLIGNLNSLSTLYRNCGRY
jgi:hypothetical protein